MRSGAAPMANLKRAMATAFLVLTALLASCSAEAPQAIEGIDRGESSTSSSNDQPDTSSSDPEPEDPDPEEPEPEDPPAEPTPEPTPTPSPEIYDTMVVQTHPTGVQAQVRRMTFTADSTTVLLSIVNGREFDTRLRTTRTQTSLFDAAGREYPAEPIEDLEFLETEIVELPLLQFERIDPNAGIDNIDVTAGVTPLPADFGIADTASHEFGMQVRLFGMAFTETSIALSVEVINNGPQGARFNGGRYEGFLEDDLGNRYQIELTPDDYALRIDDGERQPGVLVFAGRIDPNATSISGVLNDSGEPDGRSLTPRLVFGPYNLDGSTPPAGGALDAITDEQQFTHPNGAELVMRNITFTETGTIVSLVAENGERRNSIRLNLGSRTFLLDDLGNRYALLPPPDNTDLQVPAGAGLDAELSFPGAINLDATTIEVVFNDGRDAEEDDPASSGFPEARFGPFPLTRSAPVVGQPPVDIPNVTTMGVEALEGSATTPLTLIFDEFDGRLVDGGVLITLPQDILFDSGSARLRGASRDTIDKVVQITEFYSGDQMTVIGHTDSDGDEASNQQLSEQRAASVVDALIAAGADPALVSAEGRGESEPVASNDSPDGKQANRRVDVFFATDKGLPE